MKRSVIVGSITFAGAATTAVLVAASYPVAIWAVGFAALYKITHPTPQPKHICPLIEATVTEEALADVACTTSRRVK